VPSTDTFIDKDSSINEHIEQMRLSATKSLLERRDSIIVATVSAIYGLGDPRSYLNMVLHLTRGDTLDQRALLRRLTDMQYQRNDVELRRGTFRVRGDVIDVYPAESDSEALRVELFDEEIVKLSVFDPLTGEIVNVVPRYTVFPETITSRRAKPCSMPSTTSSRNCANGSNICTRLTSWWRRNGWINARVSTSK